MTDWLNWPYDRYDPRFEAAAIRRALNQYGVSGVKFGAYNEAEKDAIAALLTPEERARVRFTWWTWGNHGERKVPVVAPVASPPAATD